MAECAKPPGQLLVYRAKKLLHTGLRTGHTYLITLSVCLSVYYVVCVPVVAFTVCENYTMLIPTNPGYTETGEHWLTSGACLVARQEGVRGRHAVGDFVVCFGCGGGSCLIVVFFIERTRPAANTRPPYPIYLTTSTCVPTGGYYLTINGILSVCVYV